MAPCWSLNGPLSVGDSLGEQTTMAEDEMFDLSLATFQSMADRMSSEYGRFAGIILLVSLGVSVGILLMCAALILRVNVCSTGTSSGGFRTSSGGTRNTAGEQTGTDDQESLKYLRSI